jgi:uncharacterized membrane protein YgdD (TMEM256/DUF423 family)
VTRTLVVLAGVHGLIGVALGAFGAHALKERVSPERLERLETGVRYLVYDLPGLLAIAWLSTDCEGGRSRSSEAGLSGSASSCRVIPGPRTSSAADRYFL